MPPQAPSALRRSGPSRNVVVRIDSAAGSIIAAPTPWASRTDARDLAISLVASYQGIALLANTFRDPGLMATQGRRLERWIDSLSPGE